jgi:hypothetical protein
MVHLLELFSPCHPLNLVSDYSQFVLGCYVAESSQKPDFGLCIALRSPQQTFGFAKPEILFLTILIWFGGS